MVDDIRRSAGGGSFLDMIPKEDREAVRKLAAGSHGTTDVNDEALSWLTRKAIAEKVCVRDRGLLSMPDIRCKTPAQILVLTPAGDVVTFSNPVGEEGVRERHYWRMEDDEKTIPHPVQDVIESGKVVAGEKFRTRQLEDPIQVTSIHATTEPNMRLDKVCAELRGRFKIADEYIKQDESARSKAG